jgi:RNA polymerase sigma factor (TIGR02999 family)
LVYLEKDTRQLETKQEDYPLEPSCGFECAFCASDAVALRTRAFGWLAFGFGICSFFMSDVTRILSAIEQGDPHAAGELLPLVYDELRKLAADRMAQENPGHTLQATALVHEAYLRLVDSTEAQQWDSRGHFFAAAAESMRRILVENARKKKRQRHGGGRRRVDLREAVSLADSPDDDLLALDEALSRLAAQEPAKAELVKLRYFAGLSIDDAADLMHISRSTAKRYWAFARAWLLAEIDDAEPEKKS